MTTDHLQIIPLGTGGYIPTVERETATILIRHKQTALMLDVGTGVARLLDAHYCNLLSGVDTLNVALSHYHLDHVIGLTWLLKVWSSPVRLYAPTRPLMDADHDTALARLTESPLFGLPLSRFPFPVEVVPIRAAETLSIGSLNIQTIPQAHGDCGSVGFRIDDAFAYITDTDPKSDHAGFLAGVQIALMDAMYDSKDYVSLSAPDHGSSKTVAAIAAQAHVGALGLIHINPSYDQERCSGLLREAQEVFGNSSIPVDGCAISLR